MKAENQKMFRSNVHLHIPHSYNITLTVYIYIYIYTQKKRESARESEHKWGFFLPHPYEFMSETQCFQCIK